MCLLESTMSVVPGRFKLGWFAGIDDERGSGNDQSE